MIASPRVRRFVRIEVVEIGKQLLITRGAITTFSIANDVAKYFAIIPAMFMATYPVLAGLPDAWRFFDVAFVVVLLSLLVQGPTLAPLARRLGLDASAAAD